MSGTIFTVSVFSVLLAYRMGVAASFTIMIIRGSGEFSTALAGTEVAGSIYVVLYGSSLIFFGLSVNRYFFYFGGW